MWTWRRRCWRRVDGAAAGRRQAYDARVRWLVVIALLGCKPTDSKPAATTAEQDRQPAEQKPAPKPPDEMDEKMRHCPLALDGATSKLEDIPGGVRFTVKVPEASLDDARRRARHVVEFAAKRTRKGHGEFDGQGGGHMKNCPVVTEGVAISATDIDGGVQLDITAESDHVDGLRAESRERATKFPFVGATISIAQP